jgi:uncharacterized protein
MRLKKMKKLAYRTLGIVCVGMAYVGLVTPGIPFSIFLVIAAWAFARSSETWHSWIYNHPIFGEFLTNWNTKRIFPTRGKYIMIATMSSTLIITWFMTENVKAILWSGGFMVLVAVWAWRYPGDENEYNLRIARNQPVGWFS